MEFKIREGTGKDSVGIATVHLRTWQTSYREFFPTEHLDTYSIPESAQKWKTRIESNAVNGVKLLVAVVPQNTIIGFASGGPAGVYEKDNHVKYDCEIFAIYVLNKFQNKGVGYSLIRGMVSHFRKMGWKSMIIWTLKESLYRRFYEKLGGLPLETQLYTKWGTEHELSGYVWKEISSITQKV